MSVSLNIFISQVVLNDGTLHPQHCANIKRFGAATFDFLPEADPDWHARFWKLNNWLISANVERYLIYNTEKVAPVTTRAVARILRDLSFLAQRFPVLIPGNELLNAGMSEAAWIAFHKKACGTIHAANPSCLIGCAGDLNTDPSRFEYLVSHGLFSHPAHQYYNAHPYLWGPAEYFSKVYPQCRKILDAAGLQRIKIMVGEWGHDQWTPDLFSEWVARCKENQCYLFNAYSQLSLPQAAIDALPAVG